MPNQQPRNGLHQKKIILSVWWDIQGIIYSQLLDNNQTITSNLYCSQLCHLKTALGKKCPSLFNRNGVIPPSRLCPSSQNSADWRSLWGARLGKIVSPDYHLFTRSEAGHELVSYFTLKPKRFCKRVPC